MTATAIRFHFETIKRQIAEMEAAEATGDTLTAAMIWDAIVSRKHLLAARGVILA